MQPQLDLVLVNPGGRRRIYQSLGATLAAIEPPVWAGMMAGFAHGHGFSCAVLDANAEDLTPEEIADRVAEMAPRLAAVVVYGHNPSASTQMMPAAGATCLALKRRDPALKVLLVGGHVAALPQRTLREEAADFACGGEGPQTLVDLLQALRAGEGGRLANVRDLWYRDGGAIRAGPPAPLVKDKDLDRQMPGPAWDLLPMTRYRAHNWHCFGHLERQPYAALYTTLGCPYRCTFCCIQAPFKNGEQVAGYKAEVNSYRFWSPRTVLGQIDTLVNTHGVRNIKFADEMFVLNQRHVLGVCDLIIERGYDLNIWAYARVDTVREDRVLERLRMAGFRWLAFGIEAGTDRVRNDVKKGFAQEEIVSTMEKVKAAGINVGANYIFGLPEDDRASMQATLDLALAINAEYANFYAAMAYPGSALYQTALAADWPLPDDWGGYSQHSTDTLPLPTKHLSGAEVLRFRDHAFQVYYDRPEYLAKMERTFGPATVQDIRKMASFRLARQHA